MEDTVSINHFRDGRLVLRGSLFNGDFSFSLTLTDIKRPAADSGTYPPSDEEREKMGEIISRFIEDSENLVLQTIKRIEDENSDE